MAEFEIIQDTRRTFIDTLIELAEKDDKIVLIVPDVGFLYIEAFKEKFPSRFFNFGVTETSTVLIACALALDGWKPYIYSMINFVAFRPFEAVRNGIYFHKANVKLLGVKGSTGYKFLGFSHNMKDNFEDVAILHSYMQCFVPESNDEVRKVIKESYAKCIAAYIRL